MTAKPLIRIVDDDEALTASSAMLLEAMGWDVGMLPCGIRAAPFSMRPI